MPSWARVIPERSSKQLKMKMKLFWSSFLVGKKTARQIILDLKGKLADVVPEMIENLFNHEERLEKQTAETALEEALEALRVLGYAEKEIKKVLPHLKEEIGLTTDQYVKKALQKLLK